MGRYISPEKRRRRFKICIITVPVVIIVIVVLIVGLYFGLHHDDRNSNSNSSPSSIYPAAPTTSSLSPSRTGSLSTPTATTSSVNSSRTSSIPTPTPTTSSLRSSRTSSISTPVPTISSSSSNSLSLTPTPTPTGNNTSPNNTNPVRLAAVPAFLGNVTSTNTPDVRDGGWAGNIGDTYILIYADTKPCEDYQSNCYGLTASNSAGLATKNPDRYIDIDVDNGHAQAFCANITGENDGVAIWLSNVVQTGTDSGIVFYIRLNRKNTANQYVEGGGVAKISTAGSKPRCSNQTEQWWEESEPHFGDHNALVAPDGYIYAFGGGGGGKGANGSSLFVTRVQPSAADDLNAYEYWNGGEYTSSRLYNSPEEAVVMVNGQGTVVYSPFYGKYLYFAPGCFAEQCITVSAADRPEGPWSQETEIYASSDSPDGYAMYAPAVQPQYSDSDMQYLVLTYTGNTGGGVVIQAINMTFVKS